MEVVSWALELLAGVMAIPVTLLCVEIIAAVVRPHPEHSAHPNPDFSGRIAVLVPAHNESVGIISTLNDIKAQLRNGDRLLVVADNCTDDTAAVAAAAGAEVVERNDPTLIGKGYALDRGLSALSRDPPEFVVMIDADCRLAQRSMQELIANCARTRRPQQALYLMTAPENSRVNQQIAEFAWRVKNWVRPLGLAALGQPCQLMGTGMAFPWSVIRSAELADASLVEDLKLGLELTSAGYPPMFCPSARVSSEFAASVLGAQIQRQRWEQGHVSMILTTAPRLIGIALARKNISLLVLALDLAVPPLSLLGMFVTVILAIAGLASLFGSTGLMVAAADFLAFFIAVVLAWSRFGRDVLPPGAILSIPSYVVEKLSMYRQILFGRMAAQWIRTDRTKS